MKTRRLDWHETQMYMFAMSMIKKKKIKSRYELPDFFKDVMGDFKE